MKHITVNIIEDNQLVAELLKEHLEKHNILVPNLFYSGNSFINQLDSIEIPDILLLDLRMDDGDGKQVLEAISNSEVKTRVIVLSSYYEPHFLGYMFKIGCHAFLSKQVSHTHLIKVIRQVQERGYFFDEEQMELMRGQMTPKPIGIPKTDSDLLTKRELEVLKLLCEQLTAKEISDRLYISKKTVESHKSNLLLKTGAKNIAGLIIFASQQKLIDLDNIPL